MQIHDLPCGAAPFNIVSAYRDFEDHALSLLRKKLANSSPASSLREIVEVCERAGENTSIDLIGHTANGALTIGDWKVSPKPSKNEAALFAALGDAMRSRNIGVLRFLGCGSALTRLALKGMVAAKSLINKAGSGVEVTVWGTTGPIDENNFTESGFTRRDYCNTLRRPSILTQGRVMAEIAVREAWVRTLNDGRATRGALQIEELQQEDLSVSLVRRARYPRHSQWKITVLSDAFVEPVLSQVCSVGKWVASASLLSLPDREILLNVAAGRYVRAQHLFGGAVWSVNGNDGNVWLAPAPVQIGIMECQIGDVV